MNTIENRIVDVNVIQDGAFFYIDQKVLKSRGTIRWQYTDESGLVQKPVVKDTDILGALFARMWFYEYVSSLLPKHEIRIHWG